MPSEAPSANGVIIHPGAIGDCLLTLPLAAYMKRVLKLRRLDFIGRMEAVEFYPHRTCIDRVRSLDGIPMHRLFEDESTFALDDKDRLPAVFEGYEQVVSFLGYGHPSFESNMVFCIHSTHSAEIVMLPLAPPPGEDCHVADYYIRLFRQQQNLDEEAENAAQQIFPFASDFAAGKAIFEQMNVDADAPVIVIQPGSGGRQKCWHLDNFIALAEAMRAERMQPVFLVGPAEQERFAPEVVKKLASQWPLLSGLSLAGVLQALTQADLYLGNDSGISHLSAALGRPTVVLFGPASNCVHYRPGGDTVIVMQLEGFHQFNTAAVHLVVQRVLERIRR